MNLNPSRRDVVKLAGAASAAVGPFIQKVKAANDQVQYGFIGTGSRGTYLLGHLAKIDVRQIVGAGGAFHAAFAAALRGRIVGRRNLIGGGFA